MNGKLICSEMNFGTERGHNYVSQVCCKFGGARVDQLTSSSTAKSYLATSLILRAMPIQRAIEVKRG